MPSRKLGFFLIVAATTVGCVYYVSDLLVALFFSSTALASLAKSSAIQSALRLGLLLPLGFGAVRRVNGARWALVFFFSIWSLERMYWAAKGFPVSAVVAPLFVLCAAALASRPSSVFIRGAV